MKNKILVLNNVSETGLKLFGNTYIVGSEVVDPDAIIVRSAKVHTATFPNLLAVARAGAGVNNISVNEATEKGICVFNTPGANANAVAELVFIMLGVYARRVDKAFHFIQQLEGDDAAIERQVEAQKSKFAGFELEGKVLAVIGLGKIGVLVANAGIKRGMRVIGYDSFLSPSNMHQLDRRVEIVRTMEEALSLGDVVSVHVPLLDHTRALIGAKQIALMKPECILLNYARGEIFDDEAVLNALAQNMLQVFITDFPTSATKVHEKVICTPHLGASTAESEENCARMAAMQLNNYLNFGVVQNSVNFPVVEAFPSQATRTRLIIVNRDVPGMIATISGVLAKAGINIEALINKGNSKIGYNLVDVEVDVHDDVAEQIRKLPDILKVRILRFPK